MISRFLWGCIDYPGKNHAPQDLGFLQLSMIIFPKQSKISEVDYSEPKLLKKHSEHILTQTYPFKWESISLVLFKGSKSKLDLAVNAGRDRPISFFKYSRSIKNEE